MGGLGAAGCGQGSAPPGEPSSAPVEAIGQAPEAEGSGQTCVTLQRGAGAGVADASIDGGKPTRNYGASGSLSDGRSGVAGAQIQALLRFDLSALPPDATITSAVTTLHVLLDGGAPSRAHRITAPWSEGTVTWSSFNGAYAAAVDATFPAATAGQSTAADLTSLVQGWVNGSTPNHGLLLERDLAGSTVHASSEQPQPQQPRITVCYTPGPCGGKPAGAACDDGNACTINDVCTAGRCGGAAVTCAALDGCHAAGTCHPATGQCSNPAVADGTACDDGDPSTTGDVCTAGVCAGVDLCLGVVCVASDPCHAAGACDPATGACDDPVVADGAACDDGDACTQADRCLAGACVGSTPMTCPAAGPCQAAGACNPATGQCQGAALTDGTPCDDGNACTQHDACAAGACAGAPGACSVQGGGNAANATIEAPAAALPLEVAAQLAVDEAAPSDAPPLAPGMIDEGPILEFVPRDVPFASPVTIGVPFTAAPGAALTLYAWDGGGPWLPVPNAVVKGSVMAAQVMRFSRFYTVGTSILDADGDGLSPAQGDCDDSDFTTHAGATEMCDGRDNDCDGIADHGMWAWSVSGGGLSTAHLALDALGNVFVAGRLSTVTDLGGGPLTPAGESDVVVAKLDRQGRHLWSKLFGDAADQEATRIVVDGRGNVIVTGVFQGTLDFGGGPLTSATTAVFLAKLDPGGHHVFSRVLGIPEESARDDVAVDAAGNVLVTGMLLGPIDLGGGPLTGNDVFVAKLDPTGQHLWSRSLGALSGGHPLGLTTSPGGDVYLAATVFGEVDLGGGPLSGSILARLDGDGNHVWSRVLPAVAQGGATPAFVVPDGSGGVFVLTAQDYWPAEEFGYETACFLTRYDAAGVQLSSALITDNNQAPLIPALGEVTASGSGALVISGYAPYAGMTAKLDAAGNLTWVSSSAWGGAEDASGNVIVWDGTITKVGVGACTTCPNWFRDADGDGYGATSTWVQACVQPTGWVAWPGDCDDGSAAVHPGAVEACDGVDNDCDGHVDEGGVAWSRSFAPTTALGQGQTVVTDAAGHVVTAGMLHGTADFGGGPLTSVGASGAPYLVELDASGAHVQSQVFAAGGGTMAPTIAIDGAGNRILGGQFWNAGTVDLGGGPITSTWGFYLAKLDAANHHVWSKGLGGGPAGIVDLGDLAVDAAGGVFVTGDYSGKVDLGGVPLSAVNTWRGYVARLDPQGSVLWVRTFDAHGGRIVVDSADDVIVTGLFQGTVDFGGGPIATPAPPYQGTFVVKLDAAGNHVWSRALSAGQLAPAVAVKGADHLVLAGEAWLPLDLGGGLLTPSSAQGWVFAAELDGAGNHVWSRTVGLQEAAQVALDGAGDISVAGASLTLEARITRLDPSGSLLWEHDLGTLPGSLASVPVSLAVDGADLLVSAWRYPFHEFVGGQMVSSGPLSATLTRLTPACF
jgi:hypothetical protein